MESRRGDRENDQYDARREILVSTAAAGPIVARIDDVAADLLADM